ncbi:MAG: class 1 fructose-bisphosphatase [Candidatus Roseilinea sp.]|uniref:class 1 fructose-bisphosphatase n=1 Tax=Candidatus Roseilinea sp. TaxID=2838777 RepID=UPI004049C962
MDKLVTIERHILNQEHQHPEATGVFSNLLYDIALAAKIIARETRRAGLTQLLGMAGRINVQGEEQMKLDAFANETFIRMNADSGRIAVMASEESSGIIPIPEEYCCNGRYVLIFDPLDGSSNIDANVSVGTIFGIYRRVTQSGPGTLQDCLQPGRQLAAAGYIIYSTSTMLVYTTGQGVDGFTLDPTLGEFLLTHPNLRYPPRATYYSANQANEKYWSAGVQRYTRWLQGMDPDTPSQPLAARYVGSLVTDFHRNLLAGGVYYYPADQRNPDGKLRLAYEAAPLAFVAHQAGGLASDGRRAILDIQPDSLHQRTPLFIGNRMLVEQAEQFIQQYDQP